MIDGSKIVKNNKEASRIFTNLQESNNTNGGDIVVSSRSLKIIQTPRLSLENGAVITGGTDGAGVGGTILITGLGGKNAYSDCKVDSLLLVLKATRMPGTFRYMQINWF